MQVCSIPVSSVSYLLFFALLLLAKKQNVNRITTESGTLVSAPLLLWLHLAGIVLFGLLPFYFSFMPLSFSLRLKGAPELPTMISLVFFLFTLWLAPRLAKKQVTRFSPQMQAVRPSFGYLGSYFFLRMLFIASYEIWFRGFLLLGSLQFMPLPWAVVLNVALYTLLHRVNDRKEQLLCIPFGAFLCLLCIWQQTVWPAVSIHLALTLGYEITLVRKQFTKTTLYEHPGHRRFGLYRP